MKLGDEVIVTKGLFKGIKGMLTNINDKVATIEIDEDIKITLKTKLLKALTRNYLLLGMFNGKCIKILGIVTATPKEISSITQHDMYDLFNGGEYSIKVIDLETNSLEIAGIKITGDVFLDYSRNVIAEL